MANIEEQTKDTELIAKYPWQRTVLALVAAIGVLFSGLQYYQSEGRKEAINREKERVNNLRLVLTDLRQENTRLSAEKDSCNEGKVDMINQMLNRELAIKLSKDTTQTVKKIVESLIRASELKDKQTGGLKR